MRTIAEQITDSTGYPVQISASTINPRDASSTASFSSTAIHGQRDTRRMKDLVDGSQDFRDRNMLPTESAFRWRQLRESRNRSELLEPRGARKYFGNLWIGWHTPAVRPPALLRRNWQPDVTRKTRTRLESQHG